MIYCTDLWNTLVVSEAWQDGTRDDLLVKLGAPRGEAYPFVRDVLMTALFSSYDEMVGRLIAHLNISATAAQRAELVRRWRAENDRAVWISGAQERLRAKRQAGDTLVLVTNTTSLGWEATNARLAVAAEFDRGFLSCHERLAKPDRRVWERIQSWFPSVPSREFVMVGDSQEDDLTVPPELGWVAIDADTFFGRA